MTGQRSNPTPRGRLKKPPDEAAVIQPANLAGPICGISLGKQSVERMNLLAEAQCRLRRQNNPAMLGNPAGQRHKIANVVGYQT